MHLFRTTVPVLGFLLLFACQAPTQVRLEAQEDQIQVLRADQAILTYHIATQHPADSLPDYYQRSGFIHPIYSPGGTLLTDGFPEGHVHQHGLFFAITNATFRGQKTDFWNQHKESGTVRHKSIRSLQDQPNQVGFESVQEHLALQNGDTLVALEELWQVAVSAQSNANVIDLNSHLYPTGSDSVHINEYHYGGLGFRGSAEWNDLDFRQPTEGPKVNYIGKAGKGGFLTSEGKGRIEGNHSHPRWLSFHGVVNGDSAGMVLLNHPGNFRSPQAVRLHPTMPYFSVSPMVDGAFVLAPGDTLVSRYRILVHDGAPDTAWIEKEWQRYTADFRPPNIVLIMADDLGFEVLRCNGGESYATPELDRMASEGMRFTQAYANPLCTPSRVQIMTGKYNDRNYIGFGLLDSTEQTFADYLRTGGYRTAIAGKWQLYGNPRQRDLSGRTGSLPHQAGFDQHLLWQVTDKTGPRFKDPVLVRNGKADSTFAGAYGPDLFVQELRDFMQQPDERPFLAYFPMALVHDPFRPTPDDEAYPVPLHRKNRPQWFRSNVAYMDKMVGQLLETIRSQPELHNTLVLFVGDNGTDRDVSSQWKGQKIRGWKGYPVREGTRVPLLAWWPGKIAPGQVNSNLIDLSDFLPTMLETAGVPRPADPELDGLSFYPQLLGRATRVRDHIFCHYDPRWGKFSPATWVQNDRWKLYADGRFYDLINDPMEERPLTRLNAAQKAKRKEWEAIMAARS